LNELGHSGAGDHPAFVEIDGILVGDQIWTAPEEVRASYLMQTPDRHPTDLRIGIDQGGDHSGSDVLKRITGERAEPADGSENSSPETLEVFLCQVDEEQRDDRYVVSVQGRLAAQDFRHGLRSAQTDSAGLVVDEPQEPAQELANVVGVIFGDAGSGHPQRFDRAPTNPGIRIVGRCDEASQNTLLSHSQLGDFFETASIEEFV
jgi:hypothetical protein